MSGMGATPMEMGDVGPGLPEPNLPSSRRLVVLLMGGALMGKVLGFARELMIAQVLGASLVADSFRGALTGVMLPLIVLQNEGVPAILIPLYKAWTVQNRAVRRFTALTIALTLLATAIMITLELFIQQWVDVIVGGFSPAGLATTIKLLGVMALAMPASVLLNCLAAAEISRGRARLASIRSSVLNVSVLLGIILLAVTGRLDALGWSFALAFNALAAWATYTMAADGTLSLSDLRVRDVGSAGLEFLGRLRPLLVQPLAEQGQVWLERMLASALVVGSVASLDYARTLTDTAILLVSQPVGLAVLSAGHRTDVGSQMAAIAKPVLAVSIPVSIFLMLFAPDIVHVVFQRGAFDAQAVLLTSQTLRGIAAGIWAATLGWILIRMLNTAGRNTLAALILATAFAANALADVLIVPSMGSLGLGLSEAVRGIVLLGGTALALRCGGRLVRLLAAALPGGFLMLTLGLAVQGAGLPLLARLALGVAAFAAATLLSAVILLPAACRHWAGRGADILRHRGR